MGQAEQDILNSVTARPKQISIQAFFMDDTEITNNEYRQFVFWVRDSIAKKTIGDDQIITDENGNER
jgi:formylglycine-generating enzyme required for sulfatase activity